jgi:hypothetical protein
MSAPSLSTYGGAEFSPGLPGDTYGAVTPIIRSRINESATPIDFGRAIARGTTPSVVGGPGFCKPVNASTDVVIGISLREAIIGPASTDGNNTVNYGQYKNVPFLGGPGGIRAVPCEDVKDGQKVCAVVAQGGQLASIHGGPIDTTTRLEVKGYIWDGDCAAGSLGKVHFEAGEVAQLTS